MTASIRTVNDREATAERLLRSSLDHSYEPSIDIDWEAPLVEDGWGMPAHRVSLYGTQLWEGLTEEARHVRYAREELMRIMPKTNAAQRQLARYLAARIAFVVARNLVHRDVYKSVGIDPLVGHKAALANPHHRETLRWSARKLVPFLREQGIIGGPTEILWRKAHLLG